MAWVAWARRGRGVGEAWARRGRGVGEAWARRGRGVGKAWRDDNIIFKIFKVYLIVYLSIIGMAKSNDVIKFYVDLQRPIIIINTFSFDNKPYKYCLICVLCLLKYKPIS